MPLPSVINHPLCGSYGSRCVVSRCGSLAVARRLARTHPSQPNCTRARSPSGQLPAADAKPSCSSSQSDGRQLSKAGVSSRPAEPDRVGARRRAGPFEQSERSPAWPLTFPFSERWGRTTVASPGRCDATRRRSRRQAAITDHGSRPANGMAAYDSVPGTRPQPVALAPV